LCATANPGTVVMRARVFREDASASEQIEIPNESQRAEMMYSTQTSILRESCCWAESIGE